MTKLGIHRIHPDVKLPVRSTDQSACWDIYAWLPDNTAVNGFDTWQYNWTRHISMQSITLFGGDRALIPTGLILDIPDGYSVRIHPRSGLSFSKGVSLVNCEGVIDSDYINEVKIPLINHTSTSHLVQHHDRIAQLELVPVYEFEIDDLVDPPLAKTQRAGGFGSTGS
jgi:dUTP pyrophosphatase